MLGGRSPEFTPAFEVLRRSLAGLTWPKPLLATHLDHSTVGFAVTHNSVLSPTVWYDPSAN
jgi:hypothetical protein